MLKVNIKFLLNYFCVLYHHLLGNGKEFSPIQDNDIGEGVKDWINVRVIKENTNEELDLITCTFEHPFYVLNATPDRTTVLFEGKEENKSQGSWIASKDLRFGDKLLLSDGNYGIISSVEVEHYDVPQVTYNFEVADFHTYYVGTEGILVHNTCPLIDGKNVYRGQPRNPELGIFEAVPDELVIENGLVTSNGGVSVNTNPGALKRFGKIYVMESMPDGLVFTPNAAGHNLIVPKTPMPLSDYQRLLSQIAYRPFP